MSNNINSYIPEHPKRKYVFNKFFNMLKKQEELKDRDNIILKTMALNIERGIFNYILKTDNTNHNTWNILFKQKYIDRAVTIYRNLDPDNILQNKNLLKQLISNKFNEFELTSMSSDQLFPEQYNYYMDKYGKEWLKDVPISKPIEELPDGINKCPKCKSYKTEYYEMQTRSAESYGQKSTLQITYWLCYLKNSLNPIVIIFTLF